MTSIASDKKKLQALLQEMAVLSVSTRLLKDSQWHNHLPAVGPVGAQGCGDWRPFSREVVKVAALCAFRALYDAIHPAKKHDNDISIADFVRYGFAGLTDEPELRAFAKATNKWVMHITSVRSTRGANPFAFRRGERKIVRNAQTILRQCWAIVDKAKPSTGLSKLGSKYYAICRQAEP